MNSLDATTAPATPAAAAAADDAAPPSAAGLLWDAVARAPWRYDLFALLRRVQAQRPDLPKLGRASRPSLEPLRVGQDPNPCFAPTSLASAQPRGARPPKLRIHSFGLFGPHGPLPLAMTEFARERSKHAGDSALTEFLDIFHHRLSLLFYRAWADAQPAVQMDRPDGDGFGRYVASLFGAADDRPDADPLSDTARPHHAGHLVRHTRSAESLEAILSRFFRLPVRVVENVPHWLELPDSECSRLGGVQGGRLGRDLVLGRAVWDRQHRFRIEIGPMPAREHAHFLPDGRYARMLREWVRTHVGIEYDYQLCPRLDPAERPPAQLGAGTRLGWNTWLPGAAGAAPHTDLVYRPEQHPALSRPAFPEPVNASQGALP